MAHLSLQFTRRAAGAVVFATMLAAASVAAAHHGWSEYDADRALTVNGVITSVAFEQPHVHVDVDADGKSWIIVLAPISRMEARGATREVVRVGRTITVEGYPHRSDSNEMRAERITVDGRTFELR